MWSSNFMCRYSMATSPFLWKILLIAALMISCLKIGQNSFWYLSYSINQKHKVEYLIGYIAVIFNFGWQFWRKSSPWPKNFVNFENFEILEGVFLHQTGKCHHNYPIKSSFDVDDVSKDVTMRICFFIIELKLISGFSSLLRHKRPG